MSYLERIVIGGITATTLGLSVMTGAVASHVTAESLDVQPATHLDLVAAIGAAMVAAGSAVGIAAHCRLDDEEREAVADQILAIRRSR